MLYSGKEQSEQHNPGINNNLGVVTVTTGAKVGFWTIMVLGVIPLGASIFWMVSRKNKLNRMQIKINESASGIDVQLQKRFDTLTKLVDAVKNHVKFNSEIFSDIAALRSGNMGKDIVNKAKQLDKLSTSINFALEAYPQLGADNSVAKLMNEITMIERELAASRRLYNANVTSFNQLIYTFPTSVIAAKKQYQGIPLFAADESVKKDVKIEF